MSYSTPTRRERRIPPNYAYLIVREMEMQDLNQKIISNILTFYLIKSLSWIFYIDTIASKISKTVGLIAKIHHFIPRCILLNIYQSLIYPYITNRLASWCQSLKTHLNKILIFQNRALRMIYFTDRLDHAISFFVDANILPLSFLCYVYLSNLMHHINNNNAPLNILKLFHKTSSIQTYNT